MLSKIWLYEDEWRVVDMCQYTNKTDLHVDHRFIPEQLQKIFFGCRACDGNISTLINLAKGINSRVEIYKARKQSL